MESTELGLLYQNTDGNMFEASNVDFSEEIVEQVSAKYVLSANIVVPKISGEMQKGLIDIVA